MRSWNPGSGTETAKFLIWPVHCFCSRWCPWAAAARDVPPADRPCSSLCWGAPLYVHTPHAGHHAQSCVGSSGAQLPNCQDGGVDTRQCPHHCQHCFGITALVLVRSFGAGAPQQQTAGQSADPLPPLPSGPPGKLLPAPSLLQLAAATFRFRCALFSAFRASRLAVTIFSFRAATSGPPRSAAAGATAAGGWPLTPHGAPVVCAHALSSGTTAVR
jgi:hypothetical protein